MTAIFELIFGTGIYFYAITILTQYGYNTYFNIPYNFIEFSIKNNIIFFFDLLRIAQGVAVNLTFWVWVGLAFIVLVIWILRFLNILEGKILGVLIAFIVILTLFGSYNFGNKIAQIQTEFRVIDSNCVSPEKNVTYIIPTFYQTTAIITPIYTDSKKLIGNFLVKELPDCKVKTEIIGKVLK